MKGEFKEILAEFLKDNRLSPNEFAAAAGAGRSSVRLWLKGKEKPGFLSLKKICLAFRVSAAYFLDVTDGRKEHTEIKRKGKRALWGRAEREYFLFLLFFVYKY